MSTYPADQITNKLSRHPELLNRVGRLLEIIENTDGRTTLADDAEGLCSGG